MHTSSFSVNPSAPSCYSFCNSRFHERYPCYDPMGKSNKKIVSLHSNKRPSKFRNHTPIIIASSRSKMSITKRIREDGEEESHPHLLEPHIISKPKPEALFVEPSPYDYASGYKYLFQNFIKHLRGIEDEGAGQWLTIGLVSAWYISNIGVLLLNRYLLSSYGFKYPVFLTMCHMTACSLLSYLTIVWMKIVPLQEIRSRVQFLKISVLSLVFCTSVVGGNVSLRYLPVSFNQAIGSTAPFFTAVFAYLLTTKRETWLTYAALVPVVTGVIIASGSEPSFHLFGFIICICATTARALKSVLQGILLSSEGEKLDSMNLLLYMAPMAVTVLLPATLLMEYNVVGSTLVLARNDSKIIWYILFNSAMAYFVNLANFLVTKHTSALTLQVMGSAKGAVAVVVSILIFRNPISVTGMMGYMLTVFGVVLYTETKKRNK